MYPVEPPSNGHFGTSHFVPCREAVLFLIFTNIVFYREVVPFSEGPINYRRIHCNFFLRGTCTGDISSCVGSSAGSRMVCGSNPSLGSAFSENECCLPDQIKIYLLRMLLLLLLLLLLFTCSLLLFTCSLLLFTCSLLLFTCLLFV